MKTFKLIALKLIQDNEAVDIVFEDGLIIDKEEENKTWLIEAFTSNTYLDLFQRALKEDRELFVETVITRGDNVPVPFRVRVKSFRKLDTRITVLLEGTLEKSRNSNPEQPPEKLVKQGLTGKQLLKESQKQRTSQTSPTTNTKEKDA